MGYAPFARAHDRRCSTCRALYPSDAPGARYTNEKGSPRYVHPGCETPKKGWKLAGPEALYDPEAALKVRVAVGQALVLTGQPDHQVICAKAAAARRGSFLEVPMKDVLRENFTTRIYGQRTVVVHGLPRSRDEINRIKGLITADAVVSSPEGQAWHRVSSPPNIIFCSGAVDFYKGDYSSDRRFMVVNVDHKPLARRTGVTA